MTTAPTLGGSAARGAATTMGAQVLRIVVHLVGIVVLARILAPADYGLLVMVTAIIGVGEILRDFGLSSAAVQAKTLSSEERDNLFWVNSAIGFGLAIIVLALSFALPLVYNEPRLGPITAALSCTFLVNGISTQHRANLTRELRFGRLAIAETVAPILGLATSIVLAVLGAGYWALVVQQLVTAIAAMVLLLALTRWLPKGPHWHTSIRKFVRFGAHLFGVQLLTYASRNVDSIVVGTRFGPSALGLYDRAFQLLVFPLNQINAPATRVALPVLSRLQDDSARFGQFLLRGQTVLVYVITALFAFAAFHAATVIELLLGAQWTASAPIFQALAVGGVAQALSYATYWVFLTFGLTASNLRYALLTRPILIVAVILGSFWGPVGVAIGYSATLLAFWPFGLWWISRITPAPARSMFGVGIRALVAAGVSAAASRLAVAALPLDAVYELIVGAAVFIVAGILVMMVWPRVRRDIQSISQLRHSLRSAK
ncbi:PST family polysaccharide transporter [Agrococcus sp. UYP10]|uniref:lipopolysaccharide biosynthesis protein n=1 Tax=Agrococcus sp. UYP10 TaxID=1756355 RepID=UPI0033912ECA